MKFISVALAAATLSLAPVAHAVTLTNAEIANYGVGSTGAVVVVKTENIISGGFTPDVDESIVNAGSEQSVGSSETGARHGSTGDLGAAARANTGTTGLGYVVGTARKFDILTYNGVTAQVDFNIGLDGTLQNTSTNNGYSYLSYNARVFDITSVTSPVLERNFGDIFFDLGLFPNQVGSERINALVYQSTDDRSSFGSVTEEYANSTGSVFDIDRSVTGSFEAINGRSYLIVQDLSAQARGDGDSIADALNTGLFGFGANTASAFSAASGASYVYDPSAAIAPVPLPAGAVLMLTGIAGLGFFRRRKLT